MNYEVNVSDIRRSDQASKTCPAGLLNETNLNLEDQACSNYIPVNDTKTFSTDQV